MGLSSQRFKQSLDILILQIKLITVERLNIGLKSKRYIYKRVTLSLFGIWTTYGSEVKKSVCIHMERPISVFVFVSYGRKWWCGVRRGPLHHCVKQCVVSLIDNYIWTLFKGLTSPIQKLNTWETDTWKTIWKSDKFVCVHKSLRILCLFFLLAFTELYLFVFSHSQRHNELFLLLRLCFQNIWFVLISVIVIAFIGMTTISWYVVVSKVAHTTKNTSVLKKHIKRKHPDMWK